MLRSFAACGLHEGDVIQNAYGYGLFTGGLGAHYGAEALGATVIPISGGNTPRQLMVMKDFGEHYYDKNEMTGLFTEAGFLDVNVSWCSFAHIDMIDPLFNFAQKDSFGAFWHSSTK